MNVYGDERHGSIKYDEFLDQVSDYHLLKKFSATWSQWIISSYITFLSHKLTHVCWCFILRFRNIFFSCMQVEFLQYKMLCTCILLLLQILVINLGVRTQLLNSCTPTLPLAEGVSIYWRPTPVSSHINHLSLHLGRPWAISWLSAAGPATSCSVSTRCKRVSQKVFAKRFCSFLCYWPHWWACAQL